MQRLTLVFAAAAALCLGPATADAEINDDLANELEGYLETAMSEGGPEAKRAALLTRGLAAGDEEREKIAEKKSAEEPSVRLAAGLALWMAGDEEAEKFVLDQLQSRSSLYRVLRTQVGVLPDTRERQLLKALVSRGKAPEHKAVFRYLAHQHGPLYDLLGEYLSSSTSKVRSRALAAARHTARPEALDIVQSTMLESPDEAIQKAGIELAIRVSELPGRNEASVETLQAALEHDNTTVVQRAAIRLLELHDRSGVESLLQLLGEVKSLKRRKHIARALLEHGVSPPPETAKELYLSIVAPKKPNKKKPNKKKPNKNKKADKSSPQHDAELKQLYLELAVASGDDGMFAKIEKMFGSTRFKKRLGSARAFGHTDRKAAVEMLGKALFEGNPKMRLAAARSLSKIGSERALPALKRSISQERDRKVKLEVIRALGAIGTPDALRILRFNSRVNDPEIRKAIIAAVRDAGSKEGVETLRLYFTARDREIQWETFLALLEIAPKRAMSEMSGIFRNPPDGFARDLEQLSLERQKFLYPKLLEHDNGRVRRETFESANRIGEPMYEMLRGVAFESGAPNNVRMPALRLFSEMRTDADRPKFEKVVREADDQKMQRLAAWTLAEYDSADLEATFRGYVTRNDPFLKALGAYGLARILGANEQNEQ